MRHEEAWTRLPDLLEDRDDAGLLDHVRACADCQRQLFLLGRVDRLLRERAPARQAGRSRRLSLRHALASGAVAAASAAVILALLVVHGGRRSHELMLQTASGRAVGHIVMGHTDARNLSLALTARGLPIDRGHLFVLWAGDSGRSSMQVGRFMVDHRGGCRVRFNLPATHAWGQFWITLPGKAAGLVART